MALPPSARANDPSPAPTEPTWVPAGAPLPPDTPSTLYVYRVAVAAADATAAGAPAVLAALTSLLTPAERARAARYRQPADQARFVVGRASLRYLLGQRLGLAPAAVPLALNAYGKPQLLAPAGAQLHFNVAHAGAWVVLALGTRAVGIDVEKWELDFDFADVTAHCFSAAEQRYLALSADPRAAFYALWTRQEAWAKATGRGLGDEPAALSDLARWAVRSFEVAPGYPAALAYPASWQPVVWFGDFDAERELGAGG